MGFGSGGSNASISAATDAALNNPINNEVLTYDSSTSKWTNATGGTTLVGVSARTGSYTLALSDASEAVEITSASATTVTVPPNTSVAFPVGTVIEVARLGAGTVTIAAGSGVTLQSADGDLGLRVQYSVLSLRKRATDTWLVAGDLA